MSAGREDAETLLVVTTLQGRLGVYAPAMQPSRVEPGGDPRLWHEVAYPQLVQDVLASRDQDLDPDRGL